VGRRATAPSAAGAGTAAEGREETSHEDDPSGKSAAAERATIPPAAKEREPGGPRCIRCRRPGVEATGEGCDDRYAQEPRTRRRRSTWGPMTSATEAAKPCPIAAIGTTLGRARCRQPARIEQMKKSLAQHGQLTPLVVTAGPETLELVDGFKRLYAAEKLSWPALSVVVRPLDATGQWAAMLLLNRGPQSMTMLEEALVLRELVKTGVLQTEVAELCARHKTWVSRRIGLVERLHPELCEAMKLGLLHPGSARRLLSLPPGNQVEMAAAVQSAKLGPRDTELLVSLWRRTKESGARRALLSAPRASLRTHHPETRSSPLDPRLSPEGQRLCRCLHRFTLAASEMSRRLSTAPAASDRAVLERALRAAWEAASRLATELGSATTSAGASESNESGATR
jgi:ParB-like chromosome segregation protein Spo0J